MQHNGFYRLRPCRRPARSISNQRFMISLVWCVNRWPHFLPLGKPRPAAVLGKPRPAAVLGKPRPAVVLGKPRLAAVPGKPRPAAVLGKPRPVSGARQAPSCSGARQGPSCSGARQARSCSGARQALSCSGARQAPFPRGPTESRRYRSYSLFCKWDGVLVPKPHVLQVGRGPSCKTACFARGAGL